MPRSRKRTVDVSIQKHFRRCLSALWIRKAALKALDVGLPDGGCQLGVVIADDDTLRRLNREYRGLDEVTDVLSFSTFHQGHWEGEEAPPRSTVEDSPFVLPPEEPADLGEVIVSYPQALRQAPVGPLGPEGEVARLIVHGVLHLLGMDHIEPDEEARMKEAEERALLLIFP